MNKQTKHPSLFEQALAIAIKEGKVKSSKDADTFNSGIVGENYLLFSKQRKLIKSIPLEKLKRGINTVEDGISCLGRSLMGIVSLAILYALASPRFLANSEQKSIAAANTLATIAKICAVKIADTGTGTVIIPELQGYKSSKNNIAGFYVGNIRQTTNTPIDCFTTEEIKLVSQDESKNPSFSYNPETGKKRCSHNGTTEKLHYCSARRNGEW